MNTQIQSTGEATGFIPAPDNKGKPITVIGTAAIRDAFDAKCIEQALNSRGAPGVTDLVLNPDAHAGYGAPVGCVLVSPSHVYPGPVGVDIKCSMSLLQLDLPVDTVADKTVRRALINAIVERTPTGAGKGQRNVKKGRNVNAELGHRVAIEGASAEVCKDLGIPPEWAQHCEDAFHLGHSNQQDDLAARLDLLISTGKFPKFEDKIRQLGSYGGGNHFGECEAVQIADNDRARRAAEVFGLRDNCVAFLSHCGSRGFGYSVNHGAGRAKGRKAAIRELDQKTVDDEFVAHDILTNCRTYPKDEAPAAYKDFNEVLNSVRLAGLASEVARLRARFVIKDSDDSLKGAA